MDAAKIVNAAVLEKDFETVFVNDNVYVIHPPTIHKIAGAGYYLSDLKDGTTVMDMLRSLKDVKCASKALSWLIQGNEELSEELSKGTFDEVVEELERLSALWIEDEIVCDFDGSWYMISKSSLGIERDNALKCSYVSIKLSFEILNVK